MGARTRLSAEEYLHTAWEAPEPDFVDGEIVARAMPAKLHSLAVFLLIKRFLQMNESLLPLPEIRVQIHRNRYRNADLGVYAEEPQESVPEVAPLIAIEVLSPDDSHAELMTKFADYAGTGVRHIWLVDPIAKRFSVYHDESLTATAVLEVPEHGVAIRLSDLFPSK